MDPQDAVTAPRQPQRSLSSRTLYLAVYNLVSALLWFAVLARVATAGEHTRVFAVAGELTKWTQTLAALEVVHAAAGVVRAPITTTAIQVASRFLLVWGVVDVFPQLAQSPAYTSMLTAWSVTEVIRYSFFALSLSGRVPEFLRWLRYSTFLILYPIGISSECWMVYKATAAAGQISQAWAWTLWAILLAYIPGSYIMYTYMMAQRKRVIKGKQRRM